MAAQKGAKKTGMAMVDVRTALQVAKNAHLSTTEVITAMHTFGPKAAAACRCSVSGQIGAA
jgi:hypothetical protein